MKKKGMKIMKKIFLIIVVLILSMCSVSAEELKVELHSGEHIRIPSSESIFITENCRAKMVDINGIPYLYYKWDSDTNPTPYNESLEKIMGMDYIITDDYYIARECENDLAFVAYFPNNTLQIYDKQVNLLHEEDFGGGVYVRNMGYYDGTFYASYVEKYRILTDANGNEYEERDYSSWRLDECRKISELRDMKSRSVKVKSTDMINWEKTDDEIPVNNTVATILPNKSTVIDGKMHTVIYENQKLKQYNTKFGDWFVMTESDEKGYVDKICLSEDNVYFVNINADKDYRDKRIYAVYEYDDEIVFGLGGEGGSISVGCYYSIKKDEVYRRLNELKSPVYVYMNEEILGFEQPPVIENDRTLIPIRFLFEKMGATVDWNGETQTATITQNNTAVAFSIDDTEAAVNGQTVSMDVPARLINDKTMVPLRFLSEELGYTVDWDSENRIITIK